MESAPSHPLPAPPSQATNPVLTAWPRSAQMTTAFLLGVVVTLLGIHVVGGHRWSTRPSELQRIDLNRAERADLVQLPGVGERLAERIEGHRREHGPFASVDELAEIHGFGPATVERLRPLVYVEAVSGESASGYPVKELPTGTVDVNGASVEQLQRLPGIGPTLAGRIVAERQKRPFRTLEDLDRVPGIGPKTLAKLRPYVAFGEGAVRVVAAEK